MKAITFSQVNLNWAENQDEYNTLPAYVGGNDENDTEKGNISSVHCFELTDTEVANIVVNKKIWHRAATFGGSLQPFNLFAVKDYFEAQQIEEFPTENQIDEVPSEEFILDMEVRPTFWQCLKLLFGYKLVIVYTIATKGYQLKQPNCKINQKFVWNKED